MPSSAIVSPLQTLISSHLCLDRSEAGQQCVAKLCEAGEFDPKVNGLVRVTPMQGVTL